MNRSKLEILNDICESILRGNHIPTRIMYACRLTHDATQTYTQILVNRGILIKSRNDDGHTTYTLTDKGLDFHARLNYLVELINHE